jgi:hypothetical protein
MIVLLSRPDAPTNTGGSEIFLCIILSFQIFSSVSFFEKIRFVFGNAGSGFIIFIIQENQTKSRSKQVNRDSEKSGNNPAIAELIRLVNMEIFEIS